MQYYVTIFLESARVLKHETSLLIYPSYSKNNRCVGATKSLWAKQQCSDKWREWFGLLPRGVAGCFRDADLLTLPVSFSKG